MALNAISLPRVAFFNWLDERRANIIVGIFDGNQCFELIRARTMEALTYRSSP